jgi:acyl-CoA reductase-like NAD-dependent aldehyde dehydrogenase
MRGVLKPSWRHKTLNRIRVRRRWKAVRWTKMNNTGQCCVAAKRFIVVEALAEQFLEKFQAVPAALQPGDPLDKATTLGPLSSAAALEKLLEQIELAVAKGAVVVMGGKRVASRVDTGMMFINQPTWTSPELPFGGMKNSGYGRELSSLGIQEFVNKKLVRVGLLGAPG